MDAVVMHLFYLKIILSGSKKALEAMVGAASMCAGRCLRKSGLLVAEAALRAAWAEG